MARKKKRRPPVGDTQRPRWQWFTFPVFAGFTAGGVAVLLLQFVLGPLVGSVVAFYAFLALGGFVLSHLVFSGLLRSWMIRRRGARSSAVPSPQTRQAPPPV